MTPNLLRPADAARFLKLRSSNFSQLVNRPPVTMIDGRKFYKRDDLIAWQKLRAPKKDELLHDQAALYVGCTPHALRVLNTRGRGPTRRRAGLHVFYKKRDLDSWLAARRKSLSRKADQLAQRAAALMAKADLLRQQHATGPRARTQAQPQGL